MTAQVLVVVGIFAAVAGIAWLGSAGASFRDAPGGAGGMSPRP